jgi:hypothetical protein
VEQQVIEQTTETERELRQVLRDTDGLTIAESERIKRLRFEIEPSCDLCEKPIEKLEDATLLTRPVGRSIAPHQILIHNVCTLETVRRLAIHVSRARGRRF